jgi:hypothetical protein
MERGLKAPLSPREEVTLRRTALGVFKPVDLPARDIERLKALSLIEDYNGGLRLTPTGRQRYQRLPRSTAISDAETPDQLVSRVAEFLTKQ